MVWFSLNDKTKSDPVYSCSISAFKVDQIVKTLVLLNQIRLSFGLVGLLPNEHYLKET